MNWARCALIWRFECVRRWAVMKRIDAPPVRHLLLFYGFELEQEISWKRQPGPKTRAALWRAERYYRHTQMYHLVQQEPPCGRSQH